MICNKIRIPKEFELGGRTIFVEDKKKLLEERDCIGTTHYRTNEIWLQKNGENTKRPIDSKEETFLHELTHWILFMMGDQKNCNDEKFVLTFSQYLHQAFKTMRYK